MSASDRPHDGYELALSEARRSLEDQERTVVELRSRASVLIAAGAITTSFFGGQALVPGHIGIVEWLAIACFAGLGFVVLVILWPRRDWEFSLAPAEIISIYLEPPEGEPLALHLIQRDVALHLGASAASNRRQLHVLTLVLRAGAVLLVAEVLAWIVALIWHH